MTVFYQVGDLGPAGYRGGESSHGCRISQGRYSCPWRPLKSLTTEDEGRVAGRKSEVTDSKVPEGTIKKNSVMRHPNGCSGFKQGREVCSTRTHDERNRGYLYSGPGMQPMGVFLRLVLPPSLPSA